ncbi:50S ribosomal protein L3 [Chloroflexota bacterium]
MNDGIIGKKIGMTQVFNEDGTVEAVTAIEAGPCVITQVRTADKEGYTSVQLAYGTAKKLNQPEKKHLGDLGLFKNLREFRVDDAAGTEVGQVVNVDIFQADDTVDVIGTSKGRGFAGVMKRHGFHGGPKTHGQSDRARAPGSVGAGSTPGRVFKGKRMPGHMGNARVTIKNLKVARVDQDRNVIMVKGAVPGARNGLLIIRRSKRS